MTDYNDGGRYVRDPKTGAMTQVEAPTAPPEPKVHPPVFSPPPPPAPSAAATQETPGTAAESDPVTGNDPSQPGTRRKAKEA